MLLNAFKTLTIYCSRPKQLFVCLIWSIYKNECIVNKTCIITITIIAVNWKKNWNKSWPIYLVECELKLIRNTRPHRITGTFQVFSVIRICVISKYQLYKGDPTNPRFFHPKSKIYPFTLNPRLQSVSRSTPLAITVWK